MKYLEYDLLTGRIVSEITSPVAPRVPDGRGILEVDDNAEIDSVRYTVKNGMLVKTYETKTEKLMRERIRNENKEKISSRIKCMCYELCMAILDDDDYVIDELKKEFRSIKDYL